MLHNIWSSFGQEAKTWPNWGLTNLFWFTNVIALGQKLKSESQPCALFKKSLHSFIFTRKILSAGLLVLWCKYSRPQSHFDERIYVTTSHFPVGWVTTRHSIFISQPLLDHNFHSTRHPPHLPPILPLNTSCYAQNAIFQSAYSSNKSLHLLLSEIGFPRAIKFPQQTVNNILFLFYSRDEEWEKEFCSLIFSTIS